MKKLTIIALTGTLTLSILIAGCGMSQNATSETLPITTEAPAKTAGETVEKTVKPQVAQKETLTNQVKEEILIEKANLEKLVKGLDTIHILEGSKGVDCIKDLTYDRTAVPEITVDDSKVKYDVPGTYELTYILTIKKNIGENTFKPVEDGTYFITDNGEKTKIVVKDKDKDHLTVKIPVTAYVVDEETASELIEDGITIYSDQEETAEKEETNKQSPADPKKEKTDANQDKNKTDPAVNTPQPTKAPVSPSGNDPARQPENTTTTDPGYTAPAYEPTAVPAPKYDPPANDPTPPDTPQYQPAATPKSTPTPAPAHEHTWVTEQVLVAEAYDETVLVKDAWDEQVVVSEAWDEQIETGHWELHDFCECGLDFTLANYSIDDIIAHGYAHMDAGEGSRTYNQDTWINDGIQTIHHDAEYQTVHHDAEYQTIHHDAEYKTITKCSGCGATK